MRQEIAVSQKDDKQRKKICVLYVVFLCILKAATYNITPTVY
jgi:hypothetical protein